MKNNIQNCMLPVYEVNKTEFVSGSGSYLYDSNGTKYLDFFSGYAVTSLGHDSKIVKQAIEDQLKTGIMLTAVNDYYASQPVDLANKLCELTFGDKVFFGNSGAESVELAIKVAKKYFNSKKLNQDLLPEIISFKDAFHGRTNGAIALSDLPNLYKGFEPLMPNVHFADFNDIKSVKSKINSKTCAIIIEPIQGQGGLKIATKEFMQELKNLCNKYDIALIFDEVQTGNSRTGKLYAYQNYNIEPDIMATAKGLGGGFPISACIMNQKFADAMTVGSHGTTFGGGQMATAVGLAVLNEISSNHLLDNVKKISEFMLNELSEIQKKYPNTINKTDGLGLMIGVWLNEKYNNEETIAKLLSKGLISTGANGNMIRFLPPLNLSLEDAKEGLKIFEKVIESL
jgi:acetylornithine/N-succinyldiaminopimelate aminotransferase